ncbi:tellurite resistance protein TehB [Pseudovibrio sp. Ad46]|uniref:class I SAM-dependent DNA methyltransferase n=1 Tax=unclassified Pseudovibrio TaxID=2627060 RepID=UPI00070EAB97|nr:MULTISPECIES: class I SAM-dependent methyltransferase [unclassified Pseudovibrio]KZK90086.1 tellurite resistance protein TehB [Pseudovibrio sp. Ad5]KZK91382.1 tellurite resistance protein TehB [Pseudovibrio sp. Ad46]
MSNNSIKFYQDNASEYATHKNLPNSMLFPFLKHCKAGGRILELGTGAGVDALAILEAGFELDATDGSSELATLATQRLGQEVKVMMFNELAATNTYDGVYACASLTHALREDLPSIFEKIYRALVSGGSVWASFKVGTHDGTDSFGRYYNYISKEELNTLWKQAGPWSSIAYESWEGSGFDKAPTSWVAITASK